MTDKEQQWVIGDGVDLIAVLAPGHLLPQPQPLLAQRHLLGALAGVEGEQPGQGAAQTLGRGGHDAASSARAVPM